MLPQAACRQPRHLFVRQEQPCTKTSVQKWTGSPWHLAGTPCKNQSCLDSIIQLAQIFNSRAFEQGFSPGMSKPLANYSILVFCSVPLGLDNAAFPFLAYSGIPVVSFGFCNVSVVCLPDVLIPWKVAVSISALQDGEHKVLSQAHCPCRSLSGQGNAASGPSGCGSTCCEGCS